MALTLGNSSSATTVGTSLSWSHTVAVGSDRVLLVGVVAEASSSVEVSGVTYGGTPLTKAAEGLQNFQLSSQVWYLEDPPEGTATVEVSLDSSREVIGFARDYQGADLSAGLEDTATDAGGAGDSSIDFTYTGLTSGSLIFEVVGSNSLVNFTADSGQTKAEEIDGADTTGAYGVEDAASGDQSNGWTRSSTSNGIAGAGAVVPEATASGVTGSVDTTLGALTVGVDGSVEVTGTASTDLGPLTVSVDGGPVVGGSADTTLGPLTVSVDGGPVVGGSADTTLGSLTVGVDGGVEVTGSVDTTLGPLTVSISGGDAPIEGSVDTTLGPLTVSVDGGPVVKGSAGSTLGGLAVSVDGTVEVSGDLLTTLGPLTVGADGTVEVAGTVDTTLGPLTVSIVGTGESVHSEISVEVGRSYDMSLDLESDNSIQVLTERTYTITVQIDSPS